jgi:hypothetical protein
VELLRGLSEVDRPSGVMKQLKDQRRFHRIAPCESLVALEEVDIAAVEGRRAVWNETGL